MITTTIIAIMIIIIIIIMITALKVTGRMDGWEGKGQSDPPVKGQSSHCDECSP